MMLRVVLLVAILSLAVLTTPSSVDDAKEFEKFKKDFNRHYSTPAEEAKRFTIFKENLAVARKLTKDAKGKTTFGVTQFSDLSQEEFNRAMGILH
uniref:Inhibitor_I29 domain-containing protein n=1 Tax=Steinernema glaseri TaxID=37863 RepID=A0A1I8AES9_9BILA